MSQFFPAFQYFMQFEDPSFAYKNLPDSVGMAISGINSRAFPLQFSQIAALSQVQRGPAVRNFYLVEFWNPMQLGGLTDQDVANRIMDEGVNAGRETGIRILQQAINSINTATQVAIDGQCGPATLEAANAINPDALLAAIRTERAALYRLIAANNPADEPYLAGWLKRAGA